MTRAAAQWARVAAAAMTLWMGSQAWALADDARVPVLTYHSWVNAAPCDKTTSMTAALAADLETLHAKGFEVVPADWVVDWVMGKRDGATLPERVVVLTMDDGDDLDWQTRETACGTPPSVREVLRAFQARHQLPDHRVHMTSFVIAAREMRDKYGHMHDDWWQAADRSGIMSLHNHSMDHDHLFFTQKEKLYDGARWTGYYLPAAGYADGEWVGKLNFGRIRTPRSAYIEITLAARLIQARLGRYPKFFAYPFGHASDYVRKEFFPRGDKRTQAAFCIEADRFDQTYVTRQSDRYCLPRFMHQVSWHRPAGLDPSPKPWVFEGNTLETILDGALLPAAKR